MVLLTVVIVGYATYDMIRQLETEAERKLSNDVSVSDSSLEIVNPRDGSRAAAPLPDAATCPDCAPRT
jgi:hypothetical protein